MPNASMRVQEQDRWCWSAVTEAIRSIRGKPLLGQAEIAHGHVSRSGNVVTCSGNVHDSADTDDCGDGGCSIVCNANHMLRMVLHQHGLYAGKLSTPLSLQAINQAVTAGLPIALRVQQGAGHFVLVTGWRRTADGREWVQILDPADGNRGQRVALRDHPLARIAVNRYDSTSHGEFSVTHAYGTL